MLDARVLLADLRAHPELLAQLAGEGGPFTFAGLDLAARELPQRRPLALRPPQRDQHPVAPFDDAGDDKDPLQGRRPSEKSAPPLERMYATPGSAKTGCEKPLPGSNSPRGSPVCASMPSSGPRSRATRTMPFMITG